MTRQLLAEEIELPSSASINVGTRLEATIETARDATMLGHPDPQFGRTGEVGFRGAARHHAAPPRRHGDPVERISRGLRPTGVPVKISGPGLTKCYAVFGEPGTGKSTLLYRLVEGVLAGGPDNPQLTLSADERFGALILDPKGEQIDKFAQCVRAAGRGDDLIVVTTNELERTAGMNVLDAQLDASEMAVAVVLAALSGGAQAKDPYWVNAWKNMFMGAAHVTAELEGESSKLTIAHLVDTAIGQKPEGRLSKELTSRSRERLLVDLLKRGNDRLSGLDGDKKRDLQVALDRIDGYLKQRNESAATVEVLIATALGDFCRGKYRRCYSSTNPGSKYGRLYDQIINDGKIVLVSTGYEERNFTGALVPLIKTLFQRTVLQRFALWRRDLLANAVRPVLFVADEYQEVVSELPGLPAGDANFFQLARLYGCMGIVASQSVSTVRNALPVSGEDRDAAWNAIYAALGGAFFMRSKDPATVEQAVKAAGSFDAWVTSESWSLGGDKPNVSISRQVTERKHVQDDQILTLTRGRVLAVGALDGETACVEFVEVPKPDRPEEE
jgi:hypothetical protein